MTLNSSGRQLYVAIEISWDFKTALMNEQKKKKTKQTKWETETSTQSQDWKFYEAEIFITAIATGNNGQISGISSTNLCYTMNVSMLWHQPNSSTNNPCPNPKKKTGQFIKLSTPNKFLYFEPKSLNPTEPSMANWFRNVSLVFK